MKKIKKVKKEVKKEVKKDVKPKKVTKKKSKINLKNINYKMFVLISILVLGIIVITLTLVIGLYVIITAPDFNTNLLYEKEATIIYDINNDELARTGVDNISLVTYDELPEVLVDAIVATEDSRFFQHTGLDAPRFAIATFSQLLGNSDAGGASTLSMQVVKNTYTSSEATGIKGILRKLTDVYMSIFKLENAYKKEEIIEFYVNSQWLGNDKNVNYTSITGVEQGSNYLFGKSVTNLSLAEASLLAGMFQNPVAHNPYNYPAKARERQTTVLTLMVRHGYITDEEKDIALSIPVESLLADNSSSTSSNYAQAVIDYAMNEVESTTGQNPYVTPMKIYTTIDPDVQKAFYAVETGESYTVPDSYGNLQFGMAITSVDDGSIRGMSAGFDYQAKSWNRATQQRQPGSTVKPIMDYGPYIEYLDGSTGTYFVDDAFTYTNGTSIKNWDNKHEGVISMRDALVDSRNIPALLAFQSVAAVDQDLIEDFAHGLGIDYGSNLYESAAIGGFDGVSPLELSAAYATFARGGYYIEPYIVTKIELVEEDTKIEHKYTKVKAMSAETAYMICDMLKGISGSAAFSASGTQIGAKTGTTTIDSDAAKTLGMPSSAVMDNWIATISSQYAMALWIGYDTLSSDYYLTSANSTAVRRGINGAVGSMVFDKNYTFSKPSGVVSVQIEKDTFPLQLPSANTPSDMIVTELFKKGTQPTEISTRYSTISNVTNLNYQVFGNTVSLSWNPIDDPDTINTEYLTSYFDKYFTTFASKYYDERIAYNSSNIGTLMYDIYVVENGVQRFIGSTSESNYTFSTVSSDLEVIVKSSYSIFSSADSSGTSVSISLYTNTPSVPDEDDIIE